MEVDVVAIEAWQRIQVIDTRTGEVVTETSNPDAGVFLGKRRRHPGGFVIVYESDFREAALLLKDYGAIPICLWNVLFTKVEIGTGEILVNTVELAEMLKTHRPNISKAIKTLTELGLIAQVRKDGKHYVYRMNPSIMWKGRETERQEMLKLIQGGK
jgi:DNA-binding transcriptional ArsR family regulator